MAENNNYSFEHTIQSLMNGMENFISSKTVVGEPILLGDTTLIPLTDISFGMGAGAFAGEKKRRSGGGVGAKISPSAVIVVQGSTVNTVNIKNSDGISKLLDMIPGFVNTFLNKMEDKRDPEGAAARREARKAAEDSLKEKLNYGETAEDVVDEQ